MPDEQKGHIDPDVTLLRGFIAGHVKRDHAEAALNSLAEQLEALRPAPFEYRKVFDSHEEMVTWLEREEQLEALRRAVQHYIAADERYQRRIDTQPLKDVLAKWK